MAAKCAYVEKVGSVYYVRKRIPRAWKGRVRGDAVRLSLRTKDRAEALKWGLEALAVFEELLGMEPEEALQHLTRRLIDEQLLRPENMTGADLIRRRALGNVGNKIIRRAREELQLGESIDGIYRELVYFNRATVEGEAIHERKPPDEKKRDAADGAKIDLSGFDAVLAALGAKEAEPAGSAEARSARPAPHRQAAPAPVPPVPKGEVYTLRFLMDDYFRRAGKNTGSDNRANIERAVKLFEDLCPEVKRLPVTDIPLALWDELYEFVQTIPQMRGRSSPDNLVTFTREMRKKTKDYPTLEPTTLNSNYLGAITRLVRHGNGRRFFAWQAPSLVVPESKRAAKGKAKAPFSPQEITMVTSCPVYTGSASRRHRYSSGTHIYADDHIYWAPLIAAHTGMRVTEIGLLRFDQMQTWFDRQTLVLELEGDDDSLEGEAGYKTGNALRRIPVHSQLIDIGFLDFWEHRKALGRERLFPDWTQHIKGAATGRPEIHFEADFFNAHRAKWGVPQHRHKKLTFHSFRGFFIQACHSAGVSPYTILKWVGHDEDTSARTSEVHRGYMSDDLTAEEVEMIDAVKVPIGPVIPFARWLEEQR